MSVMRLSGNGISSNTCFAAATSAARGAGPCGQQPPAGGLTGAQSALGGLGAQGIDLDGHVSRVVGGGGAGRGPRPHATNSENWEEISGPVTAARGRRPGLDAWAHPGPAATLASVALRSSSMSSAVSSRPATSGPAPVPVNVPEHEPDVNIGERGLPAGI